MTTEQRLSYLSVCSGIEAASVAWPDWQPVAFSEIDDFPSAVLAHHYPQVPNLGDIKRFQEWPLSSTVDVLVGGTPCQSFSVAGFRKGLADPRGNLALTYLAVAARYLPLWVLWENVPGVLSSHGGRDFAAFLGGLGQLGYGWAYRVLDAQFFGVPQRRRRVFVVGSFRGWSAAAAVLFEREGLQGHPAPSRTEREGVAAPLTSGAPDGSNQAGRRREDDINLVANPIAGHHGRADLDNDTYIARCVTAREGARQDYETETLVVNALTERPDRGGGNSEGQRLIAHALRGDGFDASEDGTGRGTPLVADPICANEARNWSHAGNNPRPRNLIAASAVRRLTPRECERLQGFPDDYTLIDYKGKPAKDSPRYKALGNSMAVPVMRWLGDRISMVHGLL